MTETSILVGMETKTGHICFIPSWKSQRRGRWLGLVIPYYKF